MSDLTHDELCVVAAHWLKSFRTMQVVAIEPWLDGEKPDVYGVDSKGHSTVLEVKVERSDFFRDRRKRWRKPGVGMGLYRAFVAPSGLISTCELPDGWGLLEHSVCPSRGHWLYGARWPGDLPRNPDPNHYADARALVWLARRAAGGSSPHVWWKPHNRKWLITNKENGLPAMPRVSPELLSDLAGGAA